MVICDRCKSPNNVLVYGFGRPGDSFLYATRVELCKDCAEVLKRIVKDFAGGENV